MLDRTAEFGVRRKVRSGFDTVGPWMRWYVWVTWSTVGPGCELREQREDERVIGAGAPQCPMATATGGCGSGSDTMFDTRLRVAP